MASGQEESHSQIFLPYVFSRLYIVEVKVNSTKRVIGLGDPNRDVKDTILTVVAAEPRNCVNSQKALSSIVIVVVVFLSFLSYSYHHHFHLHYHVVDSSFF